MNIRDEQRKFYGDLFREHGDDPRALSSRDAATQDERFVRIARCFERAPGPITVHEIGCGLGHFGEYLARHHPQATYSGSDICEGFIDACRKRFPDGRFLLRDVVEQTPDERYDFVTLSGTFHIRLDAAPDMWDGFVRGMMRSMYAMADKGIAVNFLTTYHDPEYAREDLHYQSERAMLDFVVGELSRHVELDMGGPLYEYTVRVFRPEFVRSLYPGAEFDRYFRL